jgi:alpha-amylase/alpha-mannosidase (GH57 family)
MNRYVCIHGHFYQPPRENPWLEEIEFQDSAYPYRDWNERVTAECYAPNVASRILDSQGNIVDIVNNYAKISFNFGPTLLSWLQKQQPDIYLAILKADKSSQQYFSGHGAALAQAYNHMILPLANERDKQTQVIWGIKDFEFRFKRKPEGMWLSEAAVDVETLEALAREKIKFTVLSPGQAKRIRQIGSENWQDISGKAFETRQPYLCVLPSGNKIVIFFYNGAIAHDVAFGNLLNNGETFAGRLTAAFPSEHVESCLVHIATDGETYGHHHRFGNMALSYCLNYIKDHRLAQITVYGEFLEKNPPTHEVEVLENSSWSCAHGIERWRANCGCRLGTIASWHQKWRAPLREAMDWLRDTMILLYEKKMGELAHDPWKIRDEYIDVILNRSPENVSAFLKRHESRGLSQDDKVKVLKLLEMQRHAMLMFTSCGWFFDDVSGIETVQIIQYAARAMQLAKDTTGVDLEPDFVKRIEVSLSNKPEEKNGAEIYRKKIKPHVIDLLKVGAHFAIASLFEEYPEDAQSYCYDVHTEHYELHTVGIQRLVIGQAKIRSAITWEESKIDFAVFHQGDYNLNGGVRTTAASGDFNAMRDKIKEVFLKNDSGQILKFMDKHFGPNNYTLWDLFKNEQNMVLAQLFNNTLESLETRFREIHDHYYPLMQSRPDLRMPLPKALAMTLEFILNRDLLEVLKQEDLNLERLELLVREVKRWGFIRDIDTLGFVGSRAIDRLMEKFSIHSHEGALLKTMCEAMRIFSSLALQLDLWKTQNIYFSIAQKEYKQMKGRADEKDRKAEEWVSNFERLGQYLKVRNT